MANDELKTAIRMIRLGLKKIESLIDDEDEHTCTVSEAANLLSTTQAHIRNLADLGSLRSSRSSPKAYRRISREHIREILATGGVVNQKSTKHGNENFESDAEGRVVDRKSDISRSGASGVEFSGSSVESDDADLQRVRECVNCGAQDPGLEVCRRCGFKV